MDVNPPTYHRARQLFVRGAGAVAAVAFLSLRSQLDGLWGAQGVSPIAETLTHLAELASARGMSSGTLYHAVPTLFWFRASDAALRIVCDLGLVASLLTTLGVLQGPSLLVAWVAYLSFVVVGGPFLNYQWDVLLLESLAVASLVAPWTLRAKVVADDRWVRAGMWLARALLFKLMFLSGVVKLTSGDRAWRTLEALSFHFFTQPLLNPLSAWALALPSWLLQAMTAGMFVIELVLPWLMAGPVMLRRMAFVGFVLLQGCIGLTGNYGFFNALTCVLSLTLVDDAWLRCAPAPPTVLPPARARAWPRATAVILLAMLSTCRMVEALVRDVPAPVRAALAAVEPFRSVNRYGLFAVMTTERPEVIVEGSRDGSTWHPYEFRWKPGDPRRTPAEAWLHMPRLDWQFWFAALAGDCSRVRWYLGFARRLLEGSTAVRDLLARDPFHGEAPRYLRATLYDYRVLPRARRTSTGAFWERRPLRPFCPTLTLDGGHVVTTP